jgi:uncharacterized protein YjbJ (UPF0337 family)
MDKDRVKGKMDEAAGRIKRQVGEWTGDTKTQAEGAAQQIKGKTEKTWGKVKDAARDAAKEIKKPHSQEPARRPVGGDEEIEREREQDEDVA